MPENLSSLEPTPEAVYVNRRQFLGQLGVGAAALSTVSMFGTGECDAQSEATQTPGNVDDAVRDRILAPGVQRDELLKRFPAPRTAGFVTVDDDKAILTDELAAASHNNFYEFLPGGGGPVHRLVDDFVVDPWKVQVTGLVHKPRTFDLDDLFKLDLEERVYRFRCVETWAMVVPWTGIVLSKLLDKVEPKSDAKHVRFMTAQQPKQMPGIEQAPHYPWPYHEALRMDEAMNELTLLALGIFGHPLPKQHGAPGRLIVPWKYGYKSPKSIVRIELVEDQPPTFWSAGQYAHEYGYLSNVNPNIPHPRWSQATDYMLAAGTHPRRGPRRATEIFNGYGKYVAKLYADEPATWQIPLRSGQIAR
jgi:sulfoxide reductase catalytic subunit YedY